MKNETIDSIPVSVAIKTVQFDLEKELMFRELSAVIPDEEFLRDLASLHDENGETIEIVSEGRLTEEDGRIVISYDETELTGMEGATTTVSFLRDAPETLTMLRYGTVSTTLIFEEGKRYLSAYDTGIFPLEVCTYTRRVENTVAALQGGKILIDYIVELRGATAEHTVFSCEIRPMGA